LKGLLTWSEVEAECDREAGIAFHTMCACFIEKQTSSFLMKEKPKVKIIYNFPVFFRLPKKACMSLEGKMEKGKSSTH